MTLFNTRYIDVGSLSVSVLHIASQIDYVVGRAKRSLFDCEACYKQAHREGEKHLEDPGRVASKRWSTSIGGARKIFKIIICTTRYLNKLSKLTSMS